MPAGGNNGKTEYIKRIFYLRVRGNMNAFDELKKARLTNLRKGLEMSNKERETYDKLLDDCSDPEIKETLQRYHGQRFGDIQRTIQEEIARLESLPIIPEFIEAVSAPPPPVVVKEGEGEKGGIGSKRPTPPAFPSVAEEEEAGEGRFPPGPGGAIEVQGGRLRPNMAQPVTVTDTLSGTIKSDSLETLPP